MRLTAIARRWLYPIAGGEPQKLNFTLSFDEGIIGFSGDDKTVLVRSRKIPVEIDRLDLATGRREPFKEIVPADPSGAQSIPNLRFSEDGKSYAYSWAGCFRICMWWMG